MKMPALPNMNYAWSHVMIHRLNQLGVDGFFVAPGSRSSPLAWTVAEMAGKAITVHFDERGLGFLALGHARATGKPAVIITTSGSAVANLFPAVCEAAMDEVPLIVLTADRPPELRNCGANQAMDQINFFGTYARWFVDVPCPSAKSSPQKLIGMVDRAFRVAMTGHPGPVHLNQMFREPLAQEKTKDGAKAWAKRAAGLLDRSPFKSVGLSRALESPTKSAIRRALAGAKRGVVIAGAARNAAESEAMLRVAEALGWPLIPDIRSGLRLRKPHNQIVAMADQVLLRTGAKLSPDVVLHLGGRITSKRIQQMTTRATSAVIHVSASPAKIDPDHVVSLRAICEISCLEPILPETKTPSSWLATWKLHDLEIGTLWMAYLKKLKQVGEPAVAGLVSSMLETNHSLFLASSMPVRDMEMFGVGVHDDCTVIANRGVSGIDGTIGSAIGYARGSGRPLTLIIGDLAFLHDLNSLALVQSAGVPVKIIVINNNGGGIFSFLPIAGVPKHFETCFGTPHNIKDFAGVASWFGLNYAHPRSVAAFKQAYRKPGSVIIEVQTNRAENLRDHKQIQRLWA